MIEHKSPISGIDAHGDLVATAGYDNRVILWDGNTGLPLAEARHDHLANQCRFSPSGRLLATSGSDFTGRLWSVPDLRLTAVLSDHGDDVEMTVVSPDEDRVATASRDRQVRVFGLDGSLLHRMSGHESDVLSVEWTTTGDRLVTSGDDATVRVWDAAGGKLLSTVQLGDAETDTVAIADENAFFVGNDDGEILSVVDGRTRAHPAHRAGIKRIAYHSADRLLVTASYDRTIRFWSPRPDGSLEQLGQTEVPAQVWPRSFARAGADTWVFGTFGTSYAVYDRRTGEWDLSRCGDTGGINAVVQDVDGSTYTVGDAGVVFRDGAEVSRPGSLCNFFGRLGDLLITGGQLGLVFDARTGRELYQHRSPLNCAAGFTAADGSARVVVGAYTGEGLVFRSDGAGGLDLEESVQLHDNAIKGLAASGTLLFSASATGSVAMHGATDRGLRRREPDAHDKIANGVAALPDGRFASISRDLTLRLWHPDGRPPTIVRTPHENSIKCVAAHPVTGRIATGGYHGRVAVYDPASDEWVENSRPTSAGISCLCPAQGTAEFLAASYDGSVYPIALA